MMVNSRAIIELVKIEEKIYDYFELIGLDDEKKNVYINYLKMFLSKEKRILSELPIDDREFNDFVLETLDDIVKNNIDDFDNYIYISTRIATLFYDFNLNIRPESQFAHVFDGESLYVKDNYEELDYYINSRKYYKNLMIGYLKQIEDLKKLGIYDDVLSDIQRYNLYLESDLFDEYVNSDFNIYNIQFFSDDDMRMKFCYDEAEFNELKNDVIYSKICDLIVLMFNNPDDSMNYLDANLNFKYFISELSYDNLVSFVSEFDKFLNYYFESSGKNMYDYKNIIDLICKCFEEELSRKKERNDDFSLSQYDYDRLYSFVLLEKEILSSIQKMDFEKSDLDSVKKIDSLLDIEEEFVNSLKDISIMDLSHFFTISMSEILDDSNIFNLVNYRVFRLFPVFSFLFKIPGQSKESFEMINRNYVISSIREFYNIIDDIEDDETKKVFYDVYKNQFYSNPFLTSLFIQLNGNHLMIEPFDTTFSSEIANVTDFEYRYDMNNQLFPEAMDLIQKLVLFDTEIQDIDNVYFNLWLIQFNYICKYLNYESLDDLSDLLFENFQDSSCFDILINIINCNLSGTNYDLDVSISSSDTKVKILTLGGE